MVRHVGVIGLGTIGHPIAGRIVAAGYPVSVYDIRPGPVAELARKGANACACPADVARGAELVLSFVLDRAQTEQILFGQDGVMTALPAAGVVAIGSTLGPEAVLALARRIREQGSETIDMPISGGYFAAQAGTLSVMAGAQAHTLERALPVLRTFASVVTHAGAVGAGQAAKLAHQLVLTLNVLALLEGLSLGTAAGVDPAVLKRILAEGLAGSRALEVWGELGPRWKDMMRPLPPGATPPNLRKDMHAALELSRQLGVPLFLGTQASLIADSGLATGHDNRAL